MNTDYLSYNEVLATDKKQHRCCECKEQIAKKTMFWSLTVNEQGVAPTVFVTCEVCHAQRAEFCTEHFTPTNLLADLEALRSALPYDSARPWAMLTNAISLLRHRIAAAGPTPRIPTTPTPLLGVRTVSGGFLP